MSNYKTMADKIRKAKTEKELDKCDSSLDNLFKNGVFTISECQRLDLLIVDKRISLT